MGKFKIVPRKINAFEEVFVCNGCDEEVKCVDVTVGVKKEYEYHCMNCNISILRGDKISIPYIVDDRGSKIYLKVER